MFDAELLDAATHVRENALVLTAAGTKVGAAVRGTDGYIYAGCNVEHRYRCHDIHAEVNAIGAMVAAGCPKLAAILVVADKERFTPCGSCMDWIVQHAVSDNVSVVYHDITTGKEQVYKVCQLMPFYPVR